MAVNQNSLFLRVYFLNVVTDRMSCHILFALTHTSIPRVVSDVCKNKVSKCHWQFVEFPFCTICLTQSVNKCLDFLYFISLFPDLLLAEMYDGVTELLVTASVWDWCGCVLGATEQVNKTYLPITSLCMLGFIYYS